MNKLCFIKFFQLAALVTFIPACTCQCLDASCTVPEIAPRASVKPTHLEVGGSSDEGTAGDLKSIFFDYKKERPNDKEMDALKGNLNFLKENPTSHVLLEGYADPVGGSTYNLKLAQKRVEYIQEFLVRGGVKKNRVKISSLGNATPVPNNDPNKAAIERRVNFVMVKPDETLSPTPTPATKRKSSDENTADDLKSVFYDYKKDQPGADEMEKLKKNLVYLAKHPKAQILIEGYADPVGGAKYNLGLALRRAESIRDFLIQNGIDQGRISVKSVGATLPLSDSDQIKFVKERRVNFVITND